jgi:hypothetical protein
MLLILTHSCSSFPADTTLPFPLSKDYPSSWYQLSTVRVYIYKRRLSYVMSVPSVYKQRLTMLRMIPIPAPVSQERFLYIDFRDNVLCIDQAK